MMNFAKPTGLKTLRESLQPVVSQEYIANSANVRILSYHEIEAGGRVRYDTAIAILDAINRERHARGLSLVSLDDLGLNIQ